MQVSGTSYMTACQHTHVLTCASHVQGCISEILNERVVPTIGACGGHICILLHESPSLHALPRNVTCTGAGSFDVMCFTVNNQLAECHDCQGKLAIDIHVAAGWRDVALDLP